MRTTGLIAAPPTAFHEDGGVDPRAVAPLALHLLRQGVAGVFVNGTTGEGLSLSTEERERLAAEWRRVLPAGLKLFVHVGHHSQAEACRLARHAEAIGADAVAAVPPGFFKPDGVDGVVEWCVPIAAAAPRLPFYFYHIPSLSGVHLSVARFLERGSARIPNLAGAKFTFEALGDYLEAARLENGRFDVLWGRDEMLLGALAMGARGAVGTTFNIMAPLCADIVRAFEEGQLDRARELQARAVAVINILVESGSLLSAVKAVLQAQGVPITPATRSPVPALPPAAAASVAQAVQIGLEGYAGGAGG
jgi:N-acetylneuraminate lyase